LTDPGVIARCKVGVGDKMLAEKLTPGGDDIPNKGLSPEDDVADSSIVFATDCMKVQLIL
jgi:hypothetical protein